jgi:ribosomal protein L37E
MSRSTEWNDDADNEWAEVHETGGNDWQNEDDDDLTTVACPACGREMYEDAPQCPSCGTYPSREQHSGSPKPLWLIVGAGLCLLVALTWLLL